MAVSIDAATLDGLAILRDVAEVDRIRGAVTAIAVAWWHDGGEPTKVAEAAGIPRAALDDAIRWRLRTSRKRRR